LGDKIADRLNTSKISMALNCYELSNDRKELSEGYWGVREAKWLVESYV